MYVEGTERAQGSMTLEQIVRANDDLPALPLAVQRVVTMTQSGDSSAQAIADELALDAALAARVLRLANSAYYGYARQVSSLKEGVVILGMRAVRNLAIVAGTMPWMRRPLPGYCLESGQLLRHSMGIAVGAQTIARMAGLRDTTDQAYVAGLLADVGKLALSRCLNSQLASMLVLGKESGMPFDQVEKHVIGFDHAEVGAFLIANWNLPTNLVDAVANHHHPSALEEPNPLADCVHLADYLTMACGFGLGGDGLCYELDEAALERLHLGADHLDMALNEFVVAFEHQEAVLKELQAA